MDELIKQIKQARFIWICGNGGSAATAEHFATDLIKKEYPAIALTANTSVISMIANDYGYASIFIRQFAVYATKDDLLITISCSGTSDNIRSVLAYAHINRIKTYEFETFDKDRDYQKLEDKHLKFAHEVITKL